MRKNFQIDKKTNQKMFETKTILRCKKNSIVKKDKKIVDALSNSNTEMVEVNDGRIGKVGML